MRLRHWHIGSLGIVCLTVVILMAIFAGCSPWPEGGHQARATPPHGASPTLPSLPAGWTAILSGMRFTDAAGAIGLVASPARPGRIAGCGLLAGQGKAAMPTFALSDDSGRTWHTTPIAVAQATKSCYLFADTQQPDTFAAVWGGDGGTGGPALAITSDAGQTWQRLVIPIGFGFGMDPTGNHLVAGRFFALIQSEGSSDFHLAETSIRSGGWRILDEKLPVATWERPQLTFAVDPDDPETLYTATTVADILTIFATHDGGVTWRPSLKVPSAQRATIWTAHRHQVFVEQLDGQDAAAQFFSSADSGATWQPSGLHYRAGGELIYVGAGGHIITQTSVDATTYRLFTLNPATGSFALVGMYTLGSGASIGVVVEGDAAAFIYAKSDGTYRLPLASFG